MPDFEDPTGPLVSVPGRWEIFVIENGVGERRVALEVKDRTTGATLQTIAFDMERLSRLISKFWKAGEVAWGPEWAPTMEKAALEGRDVRAGTGDEGPGGAPEMGLVPPAERDEDPMAGLDITGRVGRRDEDPRRKLN